MTKVTHHPYVIAALYRQSFDAVASYGFDKRQMCAEVGIDLDSIASDQRLNPLEWSDRIWMVLTRYIPQHQIPFRVMERFNMGAFGVSGYVIVNSPNFISAFENFVRYTRLHTDLYEISLERGKEVTLYFDRTEPLMFSDIVNIQMYVLGFTYNILNLIAGKQFPKEVHFEFDAPDDLTEYQQLFGDRTRIRFNAGRNCMVYDGSLTDKPLLQANEQLYALFDRMAAESLHELTGEGPMVQRVKRELIKRIKGSLPTIEQLASDLSMSARSLQMKLQSEGKTYRDIANEVRRDIAITHLRAGALNIGEIAFLLGFNEISSFSSAFRKWTGRPPSAFLA